MTDTPQDFGPHQPPTSGAGSGYTTPSVSATLAAQAETRSPGTALLLCLFLGAFGAHWFYLGKPGRGVLYLLTLGLFAVGAIIDLFRIQGVTRRHNAAVAAKYGVA